MSIYYNVKQISSFTYAFKGEFYGKLKSIFRRKPPLISKKRLNSFKLVYIRLHSSILVCTCLVTRLHSSTLIHTCFHSSSDSSVFLE